MRLTNDQLLRVVQVRAERRVAQLSHQLIRAPSHDREMILAAMEFERWLAESCGDCQIGRNPLDVGL